MEESLNMPGTAGSEPETLRQAVMAAFPHREVDIRTYSPAALAFLGDAVYSLVVRTAIVAKGNRQAEKLHNESVRYVCAAFQAAVGDAVYGMLTEEEKKMYRRGRNSNPYHHSKSASLEDYLKATALETLCGYLYLEDRMDRLLEILREGIGAVEKKQ